MGLPRQPEPTAQAGPERNLFAVHSRHHSCRDRRSLVFTLVGKPSPGNAVLVQVESDANVAGYLSALANTQELTLSRTSTIALRFLRSGAVGPIVSHWSGFSGM